MCGCWRCHSIFKHLALTGAPNIGALLFTLDVVFFHVPKMRENTQKVVVASQAE